MTTQRIDVSALARVEGEGGLHITIVDGVAEKVEMEIFEPPRFFEAFLRGRHFSEVPDITARICGICPVAYQMSACTALEDAFGVEVPEELQGLRRLLYCGEWIESHALHMFMLHAPDFLGFPDGIAMAEVHRDRVVAGLAIKKAGNRIVQVLGGREIHPINVRVGGFYRLPKREALTALLPELEQARDAMRAALDWMADFDFPEFTPQMELVAVHGADAYPFIGRRLRSTQGKDITLEQWPATFAEEQVRHSTALHACTSDGGTYLCGPAARFVLNHARLADVPRAAVGAIGLTPTLAANPFRSLLVRGVETLSALDEACRRVEAYQRPPVPFVEVTVRAGEGHGASEAPRGTLYHRYRVDDDGLIEEATIVPPTCQNLRAMEEDIRQLAPRLAEMPLPEATHRAEQAIRNYDPCISCATHFVDLRIERS